MIDDLDIDGVDGFGLSLEIQRQLAAVDEAMADLLRLLAVARAEHADVRRQHEALSGRLDRLEQRWAGRTP